MSVKIIIENENDRVYVPEYGVPTIQLGDGGTDISDVIGDDGFHGICFSEAVENTGVGADHADELGGKRVHEIGAYLQILTNNPASLDVLIDKCQRAKAALESDAEWVCPECNDKGTYKEIRTPADRGVDSCPECGSEVKAL